MKILMIAPQPFFEPRGTPISVYQRLEALSSLGHSVDLLTYHLGQDITFPNVRILRVRKIGFIKHVRIGPSRAKILLDILLFIKTFLMLFRNSYDVIHSHEEAAFFCAPLAALFRKPHLYDMHSVLSKQLNNFNFGNHKFFISLFESLENMVLKSCDAVICVADDLYEHVCRVNPHVKILKIDNIALHAYETSVQPESIEALKKQLNLNGNPCVVYTGTYENYQGLDMVLESVRLVQERIAGVQFLFVGAKRNQAEIWTQKARAAGVIQSTRFLNAVPPEDAMIYLALSNVLISPRIMGSTTPLKIYSYLHSGKPVVATNISAHTQVLKPDNAYLVEPNPEAFAEGIITILTHPEIGDCLGKNAHEYAHENFSYESYRQKVNLIFRSFQDHREPEALPDVIKT